MRELLLSRAAESDPARAEELGQRAELDHALAEVGSERGLTRPPAAPIVRSSRAGVSPSLVALFGTLLGLATVATIVAVLIHVAPREAPAELEQAAAPTKPAVEAAEQAPEPAVERPARKRVKGPWRIHDSKGEAGMRVLEGDIGREPFLKAIQDAGIEKAQAYRVLTALEDLRNLDRCHPKDHWVALLDSEKRLKAFEYVVSKEEIYQARENDKGLLEGKKLDLLVERGQARGAIAFGKGSFSENAKRAGFEPGLDEVLSEALTGHLSLEDIGPGDVLRVIVQEVTVLGEFARYAGVEALEYLPKGDADKALRVYYFRGEKTKGYFDAKGRSPFEGGWRKPIPGAPITSRFNPKRLHPVLKKVMPHNGTDFGAPAGTPIGASSSGVVSFIGYAGASGNLVKVDHPGGIETGYAHLSKFAEGLKVGDRVKRLQLVGYCGSTGRSTGPHLHFSVKKNGQFVDPESLNMDALAVLPKEDRAGFELVKQKYDPLLGAIALPAQPASATEEVVSGPEPSSDEVDAPQASAAEAERDDDGVTGGGSAPSQAGQGRDLDTSVYLSDKELLEAQPSADDGEVAE